MSETDAAGKTTSSAASFNSINQLTSTTGNAPSSYGYDANGQRASSTVGGVNTNYSWSDAGRMTGVSREGRSTTYGYDGLGRQQTSTDTTGLGSQTTTSVWSGTSIVQQSNPASGTTAQVRDALGGVALQASDLSTADTGTRWNLLDNLGSVAAQAVGGSVTQLAGYDDFGGQSFATTGWNAVAGFGSEQSDPSYDLNSYFSRQYDPGTGSWLSQDSYRGLLTAPQSVNRYAFVTNNPATLSDVLGYRPWDPQGIPQSATKSNPNAAFYTPQPWHPPMVAPSPVASGSSGGAGSSAGSGSSARSDYFGDYYSVKKTDKAGCGEDYDPCASDVYLQDRHKNEDIAKAGQDVGAFLAGALVAVVVTAAIVGAVACTAATVGVCAAVIVGAAAVGGAAGGVTTYGLSSGPKTSEGLVEAGVWGGVAGAATGGLGVGASSFLAKAGSAGAAKVAVAESTRLASRVDDLSGALDPIARNSRTSAVLGTNEGTDILASGGRDLSPAQRALAQPGDLLAAQPGAHAEVTALQAASRAGLTPSQIAVSRPICTSCQLALENSGGQIQTGNTSAVWPR
ncbi:RHS repeat-associated core domain-containing protein [Agreia sp. COWG]|uniref:RHS repeat-associated core domain-containing protein n=1 Tax=Agreia sp. COWG TaxID=2773266 RepID=UPI0019283A23|nr:RHS repeat-associated core domain-containing protein [Agreia sp. COWG]CAD5989846.1 membrane protein of unknown function [Agreia sp. COWG]